MPGLKKYYSDIRFSANKVTPDEIDERKQYMVLKPSIGTATVGTIAAGTVAAAFTVVNTKPDYPRNLLFTVSGPVGGVGGTAVLNGTDQFGRTIQESITVGSAAGGGSVAGTKIFDTVTSGTYYPNGVDNTSTTTLGYAFGTAANLVWYMGLPVKIGSTGDVKRITQILNGTMTALNGGTIAAYVSTANHAFTGTQILAATTDYVVQILSSYNSENDVNVR